MNVNAWRAILAALADDRARELYAQIVRGEPVDDASTHTKGRRSLTALISAGLILETEDGYRASQTVFRDALAAASQAPRVSGPERFFTEGRLTTFPSRGSDRRAVLDIVASRVLSPAEVVSETAINERLAAITDDVAALRRALVDAGLVERTRTGTAYALASP